jgi:hypothetical protein
VILKILKSNLGKSGLSPGLAVTQGQTVAPRNIGLARQRQRRWLEKAIWDCLPQQAPSLVLRWDRAAQGGLGSTSCGFWMSLGPYKPYK